MILLQKFDTQAASNKSFLKGDAYNPSVRKSRSKPYDRKTTLDVVANSSGPSIPGVPDFKKSCLSNRDDALSDKAMPQTIDEYRRQKAAQNKPPQ